MSKGVGAGVGALNARDAGVTRINRERGEINLNLQYFLTAINNLL